MIPPRPTRATAFAAGIIAAGDGARLAAAYPGVVKPLLPIRGIPLIHWTASSLMSAGAQELVVLFNSRGRAAREYLRKRFPSARWRFLEADTRSSWESFRRVSGALAERSERFLISTVDALIPAAEIARFAEASSKAVPLSPPGMALALTRFVEDEKPLWADLDGAGRVEAVGSDSRRREFVTCGLYALNRHLAQTPQNPGAHDSLREFLRAAVRAGIPVSGVPLSKTLDVDRPEDVPAAEAFVSSWKAPAPHAPTAVEPLGAAGVFGGEGGVVARGAPA